MDIKKHIRKARDRLGESQLEFAKRFNVHQMTISRWENEGPFPRGAAYLFVKQVLEQLEATDA